MPRDPRPPAIAAGLILRRGSGSGTRWLLLRARSHREWGFPKGHAEPGEDLWATALRECAEECGIALLAADGDPVELNYILPSGRPKRVVYFPALTASSTAQLSDEHDAARWCTADQVEDLLPHASLRRLFRSSLARRR